MSTLQVAVYARVSSEQQTEDGTIASQIAALETRVVQDGHRLPAAFRFVDDGYSGATLQRPALERLRDAAAAGDLQRLYVHAPDRLARRFGYQVLLLDEFQRAGVEVVFLNRSLGLSPEDDLLLQIQGVVAEYERAQIIERSRRGKRHAARQGTISVLTDAPYGYRYTGKTAGGGLARYEVIEEEAAVVRQIFHWIGRDRVSMASLPASGAGGASHAHRPEPVDPGVIWHMLKIRRTKAKPGSARRAACPARPGSGRCVAPARRPAAAPTLPALPPRSGSRFRSRRSSMPTSSTSFRTNLRRTVAALAAAAGASVTCCKGWSSAGCVGRLLWPEDPAQSRNRSRPRLRLLSLRRQRCLAFWRPACLFQSAGSHRHS